MTTYFKDANGNPDAYTPRCPTIASLLTRYRGSIHRRALSLHGRLTGWAEIMPLGAALARPLWRADTNWRAYVCADQRIRREA